MSQFFLDHKFVQHPLLANGHLQTISGRYLPASNNLPRARSYNMELEDGDNIIYLENHPGSKSPMRKIVFMAHGLAGDADATYMRRIAGTFHQRGWISVRMNHRGCGAGSGLARNMYHSGRSDDLSTVLQHLQSRYPETPIFAIGFSLSGNALLKLLGENRSAIPETVCGAAAITPPIILSSCAEALATKSNYIYDRRFVRILAADMSTRAEVFDHFPKFHFPKHMKVREFDEICTAPLNGFESAEDYYTRCSAKQFLPKISLPTVILAADNDPFIPKPTFDNMPVNEHLQLHLTRGGGHMGFISKYHTPLANHRWMDYFILQAAETALRIDRS